MRPPNPKPELKSFEYSDVTLAGWIDIATGDLELPARQRIAIEIQSHYAEAVSAHVAVGEAESTAQATALTELGDPAQAARNFKKSHLTEAEAKSVNTMEEEAARPFFVGCDLCIDCSGIIALALFCCPASWGLRPYCGLAVLLYATKRLIPRLLFLQQQSPEIQRRNLALASLVSPVALTLTLPFVLPDRNLVSSAIWFLMIGRFCIAPFRIWNKLRKTAEEPTGSCDA